MKVGDLVKFPCDEEIVPVGVVLQTTANGALRGDPSTRPRVKVYWIQDQEISWEPIKWLEVINAAR